MEKCLVALCIITYERGPVIREFFENWSKEYVAAGIDIYVYDSSYSDETDQVMRKWADGEHIFYIRTDPGLGAEKFLMLYRNVGQEKKYSFIWVSNDRMRFRKEALSRLMQYLDLCYDIVVMGGYMMEPEYEKLDNQHYTDRDSFFHDCVGYTGFTNTTLVNQDTLLNNVDWDYVEKNYMRPPYFSNYFWLIYFFGIAGLQDFQGLYLAMKPGSVYSSPLAKSSGWLETFFEIWCVDVVECLKALPDCYTRRDNTSFKYLNGRFMNWEGILWFRRNRKYTLHVFFKYYFRWHWITPMNRAQLFFGAMIPCSVARAYFEKREKGLLQRLKRFCDTHSCVIFYGAGRCGEILDEYFTFHGMEYAAFCASHRKMDKLTCCRHEIRIFDEIKNDLLGEKEKTGFILSMNQKNTRQVLPALRAVVDASDIFYEERMIHIMSVELGYW